MVRPDIWPGRVKWGMKRSHNEGTTTLQSVPTSHLLMDATMSGSWWEAMT